MAEASDSKSAKSSTGSAKAGRPISDVAHPNQTAPDPSSRSIIVTNRPIMKDPMVVHGDKAAEVVVAEEKKPEKAASELKIVTTDNKAVEDSEKPEPETEAKTESKTEAKPEEPAKKEIDDAKSAESEKPEKDEVKKPEADETEKTEEGDAGTTPKSEGDAESIDAEETKQNEHDAEVQKLVESKKYFLTINAVEKRRSQRFVLLGVALSIILALAWADVALDAGLIQLGGVKSVTHFFSN